MKARVECAVPGLIALAVSLFLAGCGGDGASPTEPPATITSVTLATSNVMVQTGQSFHFTFFVEGTGNFSRAVEWSVNDIPGGNATVGTISADGLYTAPSTVPNPDTVTVNVVSVADRTKFATATITIIPLVSVTVSPTSATVETRMSVQFTAQVSGISDTSVQWFVDGFPGGHPAIGTITSDGVYTAPDAVPDPNTVTIRATSFADPSRSATASVTIVVASGIQVAISPTSASVQTGATLQFTATVTGTINTAVTWSVNDVVGGDATFGTISPSGLYTAPLAVPSPDMATVKATSQADPSRFATSTVTILLPQIEVTISPTAASLQVGGSQQFTATVTGNTNTEVAWTVNDIPGGNLTVGTISSTGLYIAPATVPNPSAVTVKASSVADPTKSARAVVTITAGSANQLEGAVNFVGPYPDPAPVTFTDALGQTVTVDAFPGQVLVLAAASTDSTTVAGSVAAHGGTVIAQIPSLNLYWAQVAAGAESTFIDSIRAEPWLVRAVPNAAFARGQAAGEVVNLEEEPEVNNPTPLSVPGDVAVLDDFTIVDSCPDALGTSITHGDCVTAFASAVVEEEQVVTVSRYQMLRLAINTLVGAPNTLAFELERIALGARDANKVQVVNISAQGLNVCVAGEGCIGNDLVDRHVGCDLDPTGNCQRLRSNQHAFLETLFIAVQKMDPSLRQHLVVAVIAGNSGLDLAAEFDFLRAFTPDAFRHILVVGGLDQAGIPHRGFNSSRNPEDMVYAPAENVCVTVDGVQRCDTGTSFAAPQAARLIALLNLLFPGFPADFLVEAVRNQAQPGTAAVDFLPNGYRTLPTLVEVVSKLPILVVVGQGTGNGSVTFSPVSPTCFLTDLFSGASEPLAQCGTVVLAAWQTTTFPQSLWSVTAVYRQRIDVTVTANPAADTLFVGWSGKCSGPGDCAVTVDSFREAGAEFKLKTSALDLTVTSDNSGGGEVTVDSRRSKVVSANCAVKSEDPQNDAITFAARVGLFAGFGFVHFANCQIEYTQDEVITLGAFPDPEITDLAGNSFPPSVFVGWSGACSGTVGCVLTMDTNKQVGAHFVPQ